MRRLVSVFSEMKPLAILLVIIFAVSYALDLVDDIVIDSFGGANARSLVEPLRWRWNLTDFPPGNYYLTIGRVRGPCEITLGGERLATSESSQEGMIQSLSLGESLKIAVGESRALEVSCKKIAGFVAGLADKPAVLPLGVGLFLQYYRIFVRILLGPMACVILLFMSLSRFGLPISVGQTQRSITGQFAFVSFAVCGLFYTLSLGKFPRLFFDSYWSTFLHIMLRTCYAWCFLEIVFSFTRVERWIRFVYIGMISADVVVAIVYQQSPSILVRTYKIQYAFFGISTLWMYVQMSRASIKSEALRLLMILSGVWAVVQSVDFFGNWFDSGNYKSPFAVILLTIGLEGVRRKEELLFLRVETAFTRVLNAINQHGSISSIVREVGHLIGHETFFARRSIYLDTYCLGHSVEPSKVSRRIAEFGYRKDTSRDAEIVYDEGRGQLMKRAMDLGTVQTGEGPHGDAYAIVPIGRLGCINLSDDRASSRVKVSESLRLIERLRAAIVPLEQKLSAISENKNMMLEMIKAKRGFGTFNVELGAIFIDVVDFSKMVSKYKLLSAGDDTYGSFIVAQYLPALGRSIADVAQLCDTEGDQAFFIVVEDFLSADHTVLTATAEACARIARFVMYEGADLCVAAGFSPVQVRLGGNFGKATLVCDEQRVRPSGETVNHAARMLNLSASGGCLLAPEIAKQINGPEFTVGSSKQFLEKKDIVQAQFVSYQPALAASA